MIKYEFNGKDGAANIDVDLTQAFCDSSSFRDFISNVCIEIQTAQLAIIERTMDVLDEVTGHVFNREDLSAIEQIILADAGVTYDLYDQFKKNAG